jgi:DNA mismatch repair ATPase MutS
MKAFLLFRDQDLDLQRPAPPQEQALVADLALETLFAAMAPDDRFVGDVVRKVLLSSAVDLDTVRYRQSILEDCLQNPSVIRELYAISIEMIENKKKFYLGIFSHYPSSILSGSIEMMQMLVGLLKKLRRIADEHGHHFTSEGFVSFFAMLRKELDEEYFGRIQDHLSALRFRNGVLISAELGRGNEGINYVLRKPPATNHGWLQSLLAQRSTAYTFAIADRDLSGARALSELRDRGVNLVANALAQSTDHIQSFFTMLRVELAFYIGCLNLHGHLAQLDAPVSLPAPMAPGARRLSFQGLYDVCLALQMGQRVVGNDLNADGKALMIVTGANQGGKSTFLRSVGLAQLMMQAGMFVAAEAFSATICTGIFTHYRREEDTTMKSGKLDEELARMSEIVDQLRPNALMLLNESFAATNEREGSEIARQIIHACVERGINVVFVTHLYEFARQYYAREQEGVVYVRAERHADGTRSFKLLEGEPLPTSYGADVYASVFGSEA